MIIKICGIQNQDTLICCENNSINFFGMIFYRNCTRNLTIDNAHIVIKISVYLILST